MAKKNKAHDEPEAEDQEMPTWVITDEPEEPAAPVPERLTLEAMRSLGFVMSERKDGDVTVVVTKGGQKFRFPGDEEKAAACSIHNLDGTAPPPAGAPTFLGSDAIAHASGKAGRATERASKG
jgi:hypothetical protein